MADIHTPRELFLHELGDILFVERKLAEDVLPKLLGEVQDDELRQGLERHLEETRQHTSNVEQVFDSLGEEPKAEKCIGFQGLKQEHDQLLDEASPELVDVVDTGAAARTEHYEIAAYEGLIVMARSLDEREAVGLLEENLKQEKEALREVQSVAKRLTKEQATVFAER
jgi:ferritin-like metal-binding protein YciE